MKVPNTAWVPDKSLKECHTTSATSFPIVYFGVNVPIKPTEIVILDLAVTCIMHLATPATGITFMWAFELRWRLESLTVTYLFRGFTDGYSAQIQVSNSNSPWSNSISLDAPRYAHKNIHRRWQRIEIHCIDESLPRSIFNLETVTVIKTLPSDAHQLIILLSLSFSIRYWNTSFPIQVSN